MLREDSLIWSISRPSYKMCWKLEDLIWVCHIFLLELITVIVIIKLLLNNPLVLGHFFPLEMSPNHGPRALRGGGGMFVLSL